MNFLSCWLFLCTVSFTKAYRGYKEYKADYTKDYCRLGNTPVCATNGHEYFRLDNDCELVNFNRKQLEKGQLALSKTEFEFCDPAPAPPAYEQMTMKPYCPQYCNKIFNPVCGFYRNEQRNFTNECELKKYICDTRENWQIALNNTCVPFSCPLDGQEICASLDGVNHTFPNLFSLYSDIQARGKNWEILNVGPCPCPEDYRPICAQLNCTVRTFTNECFLERETKNGSFWIILFYGECPEIPTPNPLTAAIAEDEADIDEGVESGDGPLDIDAVIDSTLNEIKEANKKPAASKPVYIVKNNQILPYAPPIYTKGLPKSKSYPPYKAGENIKGTYAKPMYEKLPKPIYEESPKLDDHYPSYEEKPLKKVYEKVAEPLYEPPCIDPPKPIKYYPSYSSVKRYKDVDEKVPLYAEPKEKLYPKDEYSYADDANSPEYTSFFKPLNTPYTIPTMVVASSSISNNYYAPKTITDYQYPQVYKSVPVTYDKEPKINYENYSEEDLYDSLYESFT